MHCPHCQSQQAIKKGEHHLQDGTAIQNYLCRTCGKRFSERTATPMARLRTPTSTVSIALKMHSEGMGVRASGRVLDKSHSIILRWQQRVAQQEAEWSPAAPERGDITLENIALLKVRIEKAEYWDAPSSFVAHTISLLEALTTGEPANVAEIEKLSLA